MAIGVFDAVDLIFGIFGVLASIPMIARFIKNRLPNAQLQFFDNLMSETEGFLLSLEEKGTFCDPSTAVHFHASLSRLRREAERPRMETYCAVSLWDQLKGLFNGLAKKLSDLGAGALELRAEISTTATEELKRADSLTRTQENTHTTTDIHPSITSQETNSPIAPLCNSPDTSPLISPERQVYSACVVPHPRTEQLRESEIPSRIPHLGDLILEFVSPNLKKQLHSKQYTRRSQRYHASRRLSALSVARLEYRKSGVMRSDDFKRVRSTDTLFSLSSCSTCVSESHSLPLHVNSKDESQSSEHVKTTLAS